MQFSLSLVTLAAFAGLALAAPLTDTSPNEVGIEARDALDTLSTQNVAVVVMYSGDTCNGDNETITAANGAKTCFNVSTARRSIFVSESGCPTRTWSGADCRGSSFKANNGCWSKLYASVSIDC